MTRKGIEAASDEDRQRVTDLRVSVHEELLNLMTYIDDINDGTLPEQIQGVIDGIRPMVDCLACGAVADSCTTAPALRQAVVQFLGDAATTPIQNRTYQWGEIRDIRVRMQDILTKLYELDIQIFSTDCRDYFPGHGDEIGERFEEWFDGVRLSILERKMLEVLARADRPLGWRDLTDIVELENPSAYSPSCRGSHWQTTNRMRYLRDFLGSNGVPFRIYSKRARGRSRLSNMHWMVNGGQTSGSVNLHRLCYVGEDGCDTRMYDAFQQELSEGIK